MKEGYELTFQVLRDHAECLRANLCLPGLYIPSGMAGHYRHAKLEPDLTFVKIDLVEIPSEGSKTLASSVHMHRDWMDFDRDTEAVFVMPTSDAIQLMGNIADWLSIKVKFSGDTNRSLCYIELTGLRPRSRPGFIGRLFGDEQTLMQSSICITCLAVDEGLWRWLA